MDKKFFYDEPAFLKKKRPEDKPKETNERKGERLTSNAIGKIPISSFLIRRSGNSNIITIPDNVLKLLEAKVGDYIEYVYLPEDKLIVIQTAGQDGKKKKNT